MRVKRIDEAQRADTLTTEEIMLVLRQRLAYSNGIEFCSPKLVLLLVAMMSGQMAKYLDENP